MIESEENALRNTNVLRAALSLHSIDPTDIDMVFLTHGHRDHTGNLSLFSHAQYIAAFREPPSGNCDRFHTVKDNEEIAQGVRVMFTPGHTKDHASLIVNSVIAGLKTRIAVAGDAVISYSYFSAGKTWNHNNDFFSREEASRSIELIVARSDIIIPGHGSPFNVFRR